MIGLPRLARNRKQHLRLDFGCLPKALSNYYTLVTITFRTHIPERSYHTTNMPLTKETGKKGRKEGITPANASTARLRAI